MEINDDSLIDQLFWNSPDIIIASLIRSPSELEISNSICIWNATDIPRGRSAIYQCIPTKETLVDVGTRLLKVQLRSGLIPWRFLRDDKKPKISSDRQISVVFDHFSTVRSEFPFDKNENEVGYYEITIIKLGSCPQFGFCDEGFEECSSDDGIGTGDDASSWGFDGRRGRIWCDGAIPSQLAWNDGDVIGLMCHFTDCKLSVFTNGIFGQSIDIPKCNKLFPCVTGKDTRVS
jgi:hypothetical protein